MYYYYIKTIKKKKKRLQRTEDGRKVTVILTLGCSLPYRSLCPAVNNMYVSD